MILVWYAKFQPEDPERSPVVAPGSSVGRDACVGSCKGGAGKQSTSLRGAPSHGTIKKVRVWETKLPKNLIVEKA